MAYLVSSPKVPMQGLLVPRTIGDKKMLFFRRFHHLLGHPWPITTVNPQSHAYRRRHTSCSSTSLHTFHMKPMASKRCDSNDNTTCHKDTIASMK
eukprot:1667582-Amphidinium_carterae.2